MKNHRYLTLISLSLVVVVLGMGALVMIPGERIPGEVQPSSTDDGVTSSTHSSVSSSIDDCPDISVSETVTAMTLEDAKRKCEEMKVSAGKGNPDRCGTGCQIAPYPFISDINKHIPGFTPERVQCVYFTACEPSRDLTKRKVEVPE